MPRSTKWEINSMNQGMRDWQRYQAESLLYFEFDPSDSASDPIYDEGGRHWFPPVVLPVLFISFEQSHTDESDGLYTAQHSTFTFQISEAFDRFRIDPRDTQAHFRDRFAYGTPMSLYDVTNYERQGLLHGTYLTVTVQGNKIQDQQFALDYGAQDLYLGRGIY